MADDPTNPAHYGQCTYWAIEKWPDLQQAYATYGSLTGGAWDYEVDAVKAGLIVDHTPVVGDAFAEQPGAVTYDTAGWTWTAGPLGHVGYVESIAADGTFVVSEMNGGGIYALHGYTQDFTAASTASTYFLHQAGYTPPPPTSPIANATTPTPAGTTPAAPRAGRDSGDDRGCRRGHLGCGFGAADTKSQHPRERRPFGCRRSPHNPSGQRQRDRHGH